MSEHDIMELMWEAYRQGISHERLNHTLGERQFMKFAGDLITIKKVDIQIREGVV